MGDWCKVEIFTRSEKRRANHGPFVYCGCRLVPGYDVCRRHLRVEIRAMERGLIAIPKAIAKAKEALDA